jgi:hypothetical protein
MAGRTRYESDDQYVYFLMFGAAINRSGEEFCFGSLVMTHVVHLPLGMTDLNVAELQFAIKILSLPVVSRFLSNTTRDESLYCIV